MALLGRWQMCGGFGICVSKTAVKAEDTEAQYWVQNTDEVYELIAALASIVDGDPDRAFVSKINAAEPAEWKMVTPSGSEDDLANFKLGAKSGGSGSGRASP